MQWIRDGVGSAAYADDIDNQSPTGNYGYDSIGNMIRDDQGGITSIEWTVYGKIKKISKSSGQTISYGYDAAGNRISKTVTTNNQTTYTWYVRDAQGNTMSTYSSSGTGTSMPATLSQTEVHLYGSSRLGVMNRNLDAKQPLSTPDSTTMQRGWKFFELSNHLGNVLATVSDKKLGHTPDGTNIDYYSADVMTVSDYYPFGMLMPGRQFGQGVNIPGVSTTGNTPVNGYSVPADMTVTTRSSSEPTQYVAANTIEFTGSFESLSGDEMEAYIADGSYAGTGNVMGGVSGGAGKYRYGFNGKENDNEVKGVGNQQDYGMRIYDPRLGRFLSVDPITKQYPELTPYQFASNSPIAAIDLDGLEAKVSLEHNTYFAELQNVGFRFLERKSNEYFTQTTKDFPGHDFSINTQMFDYSSYWDYVNASSPQPASDYTPQGFNVANGKVVSGRSADKTFYLAHTNGDKWQTGFGNVPSDAKFGIGGGTPLIIDGLKFGEENIFKSDTPDDVKKIGAKGWVDPVNWKYLDQKSNGVYAGQNDRVTGKTILGFNSKASTWIIVSQQEGVSGFTLDEIRDRLYKQGFTNVLAFDGSTSSTLVENGNPLVRPDERKNSTIPSGVNLSVPEK